MSVEQVIELLSSKVKLTDTQVFHHCPSEDFVQYVYVDVVDMNTQKSVGGKAYVVDIENDNKIFVVPNEMPPHFNLRSVYDDDALELT